MPTPRVLHRCSETLFEHGPGAELVGTDKFGNKYFEKKDAQWGEPPGSIRQTGRGASTAPALPAVVDAVGFQQPGAHGNALLPFWTVQLCLSS